MPRTQDWLIFGLCRIANGMQKGRCFQSEAAVFMIRTLRGRGIDADKQEAG